MASKKSDNPYQKVDSEIDRLNKKEFKTLPVSLLRIGGKLYVQGMFPDREGMGIKKQCKIPLKFDADTNYLYQAKQKAIAIAADLTLNRWVWPDTRAISKPLTVADFMEQHKQRYLNKNGNTPDTEQYWRKEYYYCFKKLPIDSPPSIDTCRRVVEGFKSGTRARVRHALAYSQLLDLACINPSEIARLKSSYNPNAVDPREIPTLDLIREGYYKVDPEWRFFYFLLACFGLRGTEAHVQNLRLDDLDNGEIDTYGGKTARWRYVPACDMDLFKELRCEPSWYQPDWSPLKLSNAFGSHLPHMDIPFTAYGLRHHYAYYTLLEGWDTALSARYMGHSIKTHCDIYWLCIDRVREREIRARRQSPKT